MAFFTCVAFILFGFVLAVVAVTLGIRSAKHHHRAAIFQLLRQCAIGAAPLFGSAIFFLYAFAQDPLWPSQDMPQHLYALYVKQRENAEALYRIGAWFCGIAFFWFLFWVLNGLTKTRSLAGRAR